MSSSASPLVARGTDDDDDRSVLVKNKNRKILLPRIDTEAVRLYLSSVVARCSSRVTLDTLRPLPLFLGLTGPAFCISAGAYNPPTQRVDKSFVEKIQSRLRLNGTFFLTNYALVVTGVAIVVALSHPGMLFVLGSVWTLWSLHSYMIQHNVMVMDYNLSTLVSISQRSTALTLLTFVAIVWKCLVPVIVFLVISSVLVLAHALLRDPHHIESQGEFLGGGAMILADNDEEYHYDNQSHGGASSSGDEVMVERGDAI